MTQLRMCKAPYSNILRREKGTLRISVIKSIDHCSNIFTNLQPVCFLGEGTFGRVSSYIASLKSDLSTSKDSIGLRQVPIAIKEITSADYSELENEIETFTYFSKHGIAPNIYEAIYVPLFKLEKDGKIVFSNNRYRYFIIMEPLLNYQDIYDKTHDHEELIYNAFKIFKKEIYNLKMVCVDLKPANLVTDVDANVYMIDFGADYCSSIKNYMKDSPFLEDSKIKSKDIIVKHLLYSMSMFIFSVSLKKSDWPIVYSYMERVANSVIKRHRSTIKKIYEMGENYGPNFLKKHTGYLYIYFKAVASLITEDSDTYNVFYTYLESYHKNIVNEAEKEYPGNELFMVYTYLCYISDYKIDFIH